MHRIVLARKLYKHNLNNFALAPCYAPKSTSSTELKCSFCREFIFERLNKENVLQVRHQSTKTASAFRLTKKRASKHKKKYVELLQVDGKSMTETKISINKLHAAHLSKLAASPVSLSQLHQLTTKTTKKKEETTKNIDTELLQSVKSKLLNGKSKSYQTEAPIEDDLCALVYTNFKISNLEDKIKTKEFLSMVKESYYNFQKATLYQNKLKDLRYAISEGLNQEFDMEPALSGDMNPEDLPPLKPGPHAVFRQFLNENQFNNYDHEIISHLTSLQSEGVSLTGLEEIMDDPTLQNELAEMKDELDLENVASQVKSLKVAKAKQAIKKKKKEMREKRRAKQEVNMKQDMKDLERQGKQEALQRLLVTHLQLLCDQQMIDEGRQVLQYYRQRSARNPVHLKVTDVRVYNILLHGYASKGLYNHTKKLLDAMVEDGIERNAQTYAATFECIERSSLEDKHDILKSHQQEMGEKGVTLNDLLDKTKFLYDQREVVLKAIRRIDRYFEPQYTPPFLDYNCPLLDKLKLDQIENRLGLKLSPAEGVVTLEEIKERGRKQFEIEIKGEIEVENIAVPEIVSETVQFYRNKLSEAEKEWREAVKTSFERNLGTLKSQCSASPSAITLYPYLKVLNEDQFVELIMSEISKLVDGSETYSPTLKLLQRDLGTQVYHKYKTEQYRKNGVLNKIKEIYEKYCEWYVERNSRVPFNGRQAWQDIVHQHRDGASLDIEESPWSMEMRQNVGKFLYNIIINDVKIDVNMFKPKAKVKKLPAVYKVHRPWGRLVRLELKPHPCVARLWAAAARPQLRMRAPLVPTAGPPVPWASHARGAYLITETPLIRLPTNLINQSKRMEEAAVEQLYPVLDSLNQLGEVPWRINQPVLDLQLKVFRSGGNKKLDIPPPSSALDTTRFDDASDAASAFKQRIAVNRARAEMHSLWCDALYKLSLANHYRNDLFWLPHNMDFRGRVYACPPHISQLGADSARALLKFAKENPLGTDGLRWLKLHAINLTGTMKKNTVDERLQYADSIIEKILDSADNPLDGQGWWMESEEPWQTVACCMEIARAMRSPNPEEYMCGFPVHQDGSCNGLQHYAALGGDKAGAAAVNLAPLDRPQDVYSAVAALVEEMRKRDAASGVQAAVILEGFVRRKVIKQTVMTTVYGVTRFGARLQIAKQLKDIDEFPKEHVWSCSQYLTTKTFDSLREMFTSTKLIQDWFTDCAKVISGVCGESVEWVTPLGLPVVQPYYRRPPSTTGSTNFTDYQQRPCTIKQRNAFPPNFIHSLDSSHMMLTGLHCQAAGITFVSVHDCFWTHPPTVHRMNEICREQFVALHSQPILTDLSDFLVKRYNYADSELEEGTAGAENKRRVNSLLHKVPSKGDFDLDSVRRSVYFFS